MTTHHVFLLLFTTLAMFTLVRSTHPTHHQHGVDQCHQSTTHSVSLNQCDVAVTSQIMDDVTGRCEGGQSSDLDVEEVSNSDVSLSSSLVWGPGLSAGFQLPVRYFYLQLVDVAGRK